MDKNNRGGARPGAGRKTVDDLRRPRSFKATDAEWLAIQQAAEADGMSASEYIRFMAIGGASCMKK